MAEEKKNVFIIGYEPFNLRLLEELPQSKDINFLSLITREEMQGSDRVPAQDLIGLAEGRIKESGLNPDAIITYWDFPGTLVCAILNARYGLNGPMPRSVFKCEHKGWSRVEQRKVVPENIPLAITFDPNDEDAYDKINLLPPFWIKPVKSLRSWLSFKVTDRSDFEAYRNIMKDNVDTIYQPFVSLMKYAKVSDMITSSPDSCIAESSLEGHMCTLEGYVFDGDVNVYGIIDSIREKHSNSFQRYQYPSQLPLEIQMRMADITRKVLDRIDLNDTCFNIEFFYNQTSDRVQLLEINPRTSQSHSDLFSKVHGISQYRILLDLALNRYPAPLKRDGAFKMASKYMHRVDRAGVVARLPNEKEIKTIEEKFPGCKINLRVKEGDDLNDLLYQDSYSFEIADIYIGGRDEIDIDQKYYEIVELMDIKIKSAEEDDGYIQTSSSKIEQSASKNN